MSRSLQIFITARNRPESLKKAIDSILNQTFKDFDLIISDNSTNDATQKVALSYQDERLSYVRRNSLQVIEHFNTILSEVSSDYFMIFHDDDIMYSTMVQTLFDCLSNDNTIAAVGSNAVINKNGKKTENLFLEGIKQDVILENKEEVVRQYLVKSIVPLPSYLYKKEVAEKIRFNTLLGGNYCDVAFVMELTRLGSVIFLAAPLMEYYFHKTQISDKNDFMQRAQLINYITRTTTYKRANPLMQRFRAHNIYSELKQGLITGTISFFSKRYLKLLLLVLKYSPAEFRFKILIVTLLTKSGLWSWANR